MILFTHKSCLDGFACKTVFSYLKNYNEDSQVFTYSYRELDRMIPQITNSIDKNETIYIIDINYKKLEEIVELKKDYPNLVYIDHHKYNEHYYIQGTGVIKLQNIEYKDDNGDIWLTCPVKNIKAGGILFYEYAKNNDLLKKMWPAERDRLINFITLASEYDTWLWKENNNLEARDLARIFYNVPEEIFEENLTKYLCDSSVPLFNTFFKQYLDLMEKQKEKKYKYISNNCEVHKDVEGNKYIWFQMERADSDLLNKMLLEDDRYKDIDYIACFSYLGKAVSFRSRDDFDVSRIAKKYGGGGHHSAAACPIPEHFLNNFKI